MNETGEYYITFNTKINPGKIEAVRVRIDVVTIEDMQKPLAVDLCNHPLYSDPAAYVRANV